MDPYYNDGQVTLWCGDARQITTWLAADVLVTDPPYGIGTTRRRGTWDMPTERAEHIAGDLDTQVRDTILGMWAIPPLPSVASIPVDTVRWSRPAVVFGDVRLESPYPTRKTLIYRKPPDAGTHGAVAGFRHDVEAVYLMGRQGVWPTAIGGRSSILTTGARSVGGPGGPAARYGHQHAKPVDVMEELVAGGCELSPRDQAPAPGTDQRGRRGHVLYGGGPIRGLGLHDRGGP